MGKVRRLRQKYHLSLKSSSATEPSASSATHSLPVVVDIPDKSPAFVCFSKQSNLFKGINISPADLKQTLLPAPKPSQIVLGTEKDDKVNQQIEHTPQTTKKERRMIRRAALLRKIDTVQRLKVEAKEKLKKEKKSAPLTTVSELMDALPVLPVLPALLKQNSESKGATSNRVRKRRRHQSNYLENISLFKAARLQMAYSADTFPAIRNFIVNSVSRGS